MGRTPRRLAGGALLALCVALRRFVCRLLCLPEQDRPRAPGTPIPSKLRARDLSTFVAPRLVGTPASLELDDPAASVASDDPPSRVVWVDGPDEALVHLDSVAFRVAGGMLIASVDLETDETGRAPVIVRFALGGPDDPDGLVVATDEVAHGRVELVSRWGESVQAALWSALLSLCADHARQRGERPAGLALAHDAVVLRDTGARR